MKTLCLVMVTGLTTVILSLNPASATDSIQARKLFKNPPREYSTGPLWVWNDMLTDKEIRSTMRDLADQKVKQVWVHPRPGLMTPYLSDDWFHLWKTALDEAKRLDMNVWIYDENSYPSGFAGGWVPELMPESRGRGLKLSETKSTPKWEEDVLAVYRLDGNRSENISEKVKAGETLGEGRYLVATVLRAKNSPWNASRCYVDLMYPGVTEKFLEVTLEAYRQHFGKEFGKRIPGSFTDEPELRPAGGLPWTDDFPEQFKRRWGYDLLECLPSLTLEIGDWKRVRHNYFQTQLDLFIERWGKPYFEYCAKNNLEFTGHYWEHEWPRCVGVPDNMAMSAWQQRPGIDTLMNQYREDTHAQFGNVRACREIASLANQFGRRTLVEIYGAGGWDLRFEDMKRIGDWLEVLGVNTLNQHLDYITVRGARKRDHPQSFSYHEPWWDAYHVSAEYLARISAALCQGEQINRILVLEPTTTAWMYQGNEAKLREIGDSFFNLLMSLEAAQIEYDLGCEDVLRRHGIVTGDQLHVGQRSYDVVVLPPHMENINSAVADLGEQLLTSGGKIVCLGEAPSRMNGGESARVSEGVDEPGWLSAKAGDAVNTLARWNRHDEFRITRAEDDRGILFHMRRQQADGQLLFLVNTSIESPSVGEIDSTMKGVERWDAYTGRIEPYQFSETASGVKTTFKLPPSGSLLLFLSNKPINPAPTSSEVARSLPPEGPPTIHRIEPNVLTLDYVDITIGRETKRDVYFYEAQQFAFQKNGMDRNPWDSAVQFKDEIISKTFAPDSGFTASYKFTVESSVPKNLAIVVERPDLYTVTCNGRPVKARKGDWWLDKAFGRIPIAVAARTGANVVTIKAQPFSVWHELEPAYLLGDFTLKPTKKGFVVVPDEPLRIAPSSTTPTLKHSINPDGTMWLSGGIGFERGTEDRQPFIVFDLGRNTDLTGIRIWNYNEAHVRDLTSRGAKEIRISTSANAETASFENVVGAFKLARGTGRAASPEVLPVAATGVRYVRVDILSNQNGVKFPVTGKPDDNGFVGLAEVQFLTNSGAPVDGVKVHRASSELASHQRIARSLVDGSGLNTNTTGGWDEQGHPFYSAGVAYREQFNVGKPSGQLRVALPKWLGSVAKVSVNGRQAGYIDAPPWECDVTKQIKRGENDIEVTVIGTLKNTLGPHHGNPPLGSAWPGMFRVGPSPGPPPGEAYSTVGYGLFEPFVLRQIE